MTERLGRYELVSRLGRGGMAEVWRARALSGAHPGVMYAIKRLLPQLEDDPEAVQSFVQGARLAQRLSHPNVVDVHEVGEDAGRWFQVMDLVDGRDVAQLIKKCQAQRVTWPLDFALYLTRTLCEALDCAHRATGPTGAPLDLVHCDVAPSNLFVSRTGEIKLGDFGVARARIDSGAAEFYGKPYYVSPEALEGQLTPAMDLWGAGVVLYELLTLRRPFGGENAEALFARVRAGQFEPAAALRPDLPPEVDLVVRRALAKNPAERFADARAFASALAGLYDERIGTPLAISSLVRGLFGP